MVENANFVSVKSKWSQDILCTLLVFFTVVVVALKPFYANENSILACRKI